MLITGLSQLSLPYKYSEPYNTKWRGGHHVHPLIARYRQTHTTVTLARGREERIIGCFVGGEVEETED